MRQARHQRITSLHSNKENELLNNSAMHTNLPSLRNNNKLSLKNEYYLNLNQRKKTYINLCTKKENLVKNNAAKAGQASKRTIQTTRLLSDQTLSTQISGVYLSSRGDKEKDKRNYKSTGRNLHSQKYQILQKHQINIRMRAKMVDWLLEITQAYKCKTETLFLAIFIMDQYFASSEKSLPVSDLHLIGVTCIFMACKYQEIHAIRMKTLVRDIAHGKISAREIINKQSQILMAINFRFDRKCVYLIAYQILNQISKQLPPSHIQTLSANLSYYLKLTAYDCDLLRKQNAQLLAKAAILTAIRSMPQISKNLQLYDGFISSCGKDYQSSHHICSQIMFLHVNFKSQFGALENIHKQCPIGNTFNRKNNNIHVNGNVNVNVNGNMNSSGCKKMIQSAAL